MIATRIMFKLHQVPDHPDPLHFLSRSSERDNINLVVFTYGASSEAYTPAIISFS